MRCKSSDLSFARSTWQPNPSFSNRFVSTFSKISSRTRAITSSRTPDLNIRRPGSVLRSFIYMSTFFPGYDPRSVYKKPFPPFHLRKIRFNRAPPPPQQIILIIAMIKRHLWTIIASGWFMELLRHKHMTHFMFFVSCKQNKWERAHACHKPKHH